MRKLSTTLIAILLLCALTGAGTAETPTLAIGMLTPTKVDNSVFMPSDMYASMIISEEERDEMLHGTYLVYDVLPLDDGAIGISGSFLYRSVYQEESFIIGTDVPQKRLDGFLLAMDKDGKHMWLLQYGDPKSPNSIRGLARLPDGRIFFRLESWIGTWGTQYYIASEDGRIDEMLPAAQYRDTSAFTTLRVIEDGFFGGGYKIDIDTFTKMGVGDPVILYDFDGTEKWRLESDQLNGAMMDVVTRLNDGGFLLCGGKQNEESFNSIACAMKLDSEGQIVWVYAGHEYAAASFVDACETRRGDMLLLSGADPTVPTPIRGGLAATLTCLNENGDLAWVQQYTDYGFAAFDTIIPYRDGYLIGGALLSDEDAPESLPINDKSVYGLLYIKEDGIPLGCKYIELDEAVAFGEGYVNSIVRPLSENSVLVVCNAINYEEVEDDPGYFEISKSRLYTLQIDATAFE